MDRKHIVKHTFGIGERHAMLAQVFRLFGWIKYKAQHDYIY